jgi:hypothetical protein
VRIVASRRTVDHGPTTTRSSDSPMAAVSPPRASRVIPASCNRRSTRSHASSAPEAQLKRTGSRRPSMRASKGAGKEPTTAGTRIAAPQSWWSHHTRSPPLSSCAAAPSPASMPLT